jgi:hypothetical protein
MIIRSDEVVVVIGRKGHGKTTLLKLLLRPLKRYAIFDILGAYREFGALAPTPAEACVYDKAVYIPQTEAIELEYEEFAASVLGCGNRTIVLDEAHWIYRPKGIQKNAQMVLRLGRHVAVGLWLATHRVLDLAKLVYQQADHLFLGQLLVYRDLEELRRIYGPVVEKAKELRPREFLYIDVRSMKTRKIVIPQASRPIGTNREEEEDEEEL